MKSDIHRMFDAIAPSYDLLNRLLSFRQDVRWRNEVIDVAAPLISSAPTSAPPSIVDIGGGTGDLALAASRLQPHRLFIVDLSLNMLRVAREKITQCSSKKNNTIKPATIALLNADAVCLPLKSQSVDVVLSAFTIRNIADKGLAFREFYRILRPQGVLSILELSIPARSVFGKLFRWYFHRVVPLIGRIVSGHPLAYHYLPTSVNIFPQPEEIKALLADCGFTELQYRRLTHGVATIFSARKK